MPQKLVLGKCYLDCIRRPSSLEAAVPQGALIVILPCGDAAWARPQVAANWLRAPCLSGREGRESALCLPRILNPLLIHPVTAPSMSHIIACLASPVITPCQGQESAHELKGSLFAGLPQQTWSWITPPSPGSMLLCATTG